MNKNFDKTKSKIVFFNYINTILLILLPLLNAFLITYLVFFILYILGYKYIFSFYLFFIILSIVALKYFLSNKVLFNRNKIFNHIDDKYSYPKGIIFNALTIMDITVYSKELTEEMFKKAVNLLSKHKISDFVINLKIFRLNYIICLCLLILLSIPVNIVPEKIIDWTTTIFPKDEIELKRFDYIVSPEDLLVKEGDNLKISVTHTGKPVKLNLFINYYLGKNDNETTTRQLSTKDYKNYEFEFFNITSDITFYLTADGYKSRKYYITTIVSPMIQIETVEINYPDYTNKTTERFASETGNLQVLEHSVITITGKTNFEIKEGYIIIKKDIENTTNDSNNKSSSVINETTNDNNLTGINSNGKVSSDKVLIGKISTDNISTDNISTDNISTDNISTDNISTDNISTDDISSDNISSDNISKDKNIIKKKINFDKNNFRFRFKSEYNFTYYIKCIGENLSATSLRYNFTSIKDAYPIIEIVQPDKHFTVTEDMLVPLSVLAEDDFGIDTIGISFIIDKEYPGTFNIPFVFRQDTRKYLASYLWDVETINIVPGSEIEYYAFAYDNDVFNNHKYSRTDTYHIRIPSLTDLFQASLERPHSDNRFMQELGAKQSELVRETRNALNEIRRKNLDDWQVQQELKNLYEKQLEIKESIDEIKRGIEESVANFNQRNLIDRSILERVSKIQNLLQQMVDEELMQNLQNLQKAIDSQNLSEQEKMLMQSQFDMEKFSQRLDDTLRTLERFNTMKQLNVMKNLYEQLTQDQNKLTRDLISSEDFDKALENHEKIHRDLENLNEMLNNLAKNNEALADELKSFDNEHLMEMSRQLMQNLKNKDASSMEMSRKLSQGIFDMSQQLNQLFQNEQLTGVLNAQKLILKIVRELLYLTDEFENYKNEYLVMKFENLIEKYGAAFSIIINTYQEIGRETLFLNFEIIRYFYSLRNNIISLEDKIRNKKVHNENFELTELQKEKLTLINVLLKEKDEMMDRMQEAGGQSSMQDFEQLTGLQSLLNSFHQGLSFNPGMEMMQQMAYEQSLIRQMLEEIERQQNQYQSLLGDLSETVEKMKNVEEELKGYKPSEEKKKGIEKQQQEIVERMLHYSQAMESEREPEEEERKASHVKEEYKIDDSILQDRLRRYEKFLEQEKLFEKHVPKVYLEFVRNYLLNK